MESLGLTASMIGFVSAFLIFISFITSLASTPLMEKFKETRILLISLFASTIIYLTISISNNLYIFIGLATLLTISAMFRGNTFGIIFKDNVKNSEYNKKEGLLYALENVGWIIGPLIAGYLITISGIPSVFKATAIFFLIGFLSFYFMKLKNINKKRKELDKNIIKNLKSFWLNKKIRLPYMMVMGVQFWWALVYIYVPLFAIGQGITGKEIGFFMAALIIPLALCEYKVGILSKKYGLKKFFFIGYLGLTITSVILFLTNNIKTQLIIIVVASFFVALLEPLQEIFFFQKVTKKEEEKYFPLFNTSYNAGSFYSKIIIAGVLLLLPNKYAYLATGIFMLIFSTIALKIKK